MKVIIIMDIIYFPQSTYYIFIKAVFAHFEMLNVKYFKNFESLPY